MVRFFRCIFLQPQRRVTAIILAFVFSVGILAGAFIAQLTDTSYFLMMRTASWKRLDRLPDSPSRLPAMDRS